MSALTLIETARALIAGDKGLLAMDESIPTCNQRFAAFGIVAIQPNATWRLAAASTLPQ